MERAAAVLLTCVDPLHPVWVLGFERVDGLGLSLPCGKVEEGETLTYAAIRECQEETGYVVWLTEAEPYTAVVDNVTVTTFKAVIGDKGEPSYPEEGRAVWVRPELICQGQYAEYNRAALQHFGIK